MKTRSNSYIGTLDVNSTFDMERLAKLREKVSFDNSNSAKKLRVVVRGRKPIEKKSWTNIYTGKTSKVGFDYSGNVVGGIANASSLDVYIYTR